MKALSFRVPDEHHEQLQAYADENDASLSDAGREFIERGLEYDDLQTEYERLQQRDQQLAKRYEDRREEDVDELREYVRLQREKEQAGILTRWKWRLRGRSVEDENE